MTIFSPQQVMSKGKIMLIAALVITTLLVTGFAWAHKNVNIVVDGSDIAVSTLKLKPEAILAQAGVVLGDKDEYRLSTAKLRNGTTIEVFRAVPVTVTYQGKEQAIVTGKPTVGELAESLGILQPNIKLEPGEETRINAGLNIKAIIMTEQVVERQLEEPFIVIHQPNATMEKGVEQVVEEGQNGIKTVSVKLHFADGKQVAEEVIAQAITVQPRSRIVNVGTRDMISTSRGAQRFQRVAWMEATAYLPTDGSVHGLTATGIPARHGIVAVDPDVIPLGTKVYIPGYGVALAADTGGAIIGNKIDLCMESSSDAWQFGRRSIKVYILE
ncbi:hypothetical protein SDC9_14750 [bioreactor metagenome]|uniref:G5 domain-containing protein n=1 Tax=bioreactor metagenome TaxID=1076179 RepID=A0A644TRC6_9ZZZZ|nr:3D domain-containing protein [Negativicutes bacterium]